MKKYFQEEIMVRLRILDDYNRTSGNPEIDAQGIDKRVGEIILISKDIENINASVKIGNDFFIELYEHFGLDDRDFKTLNTGMHVDEIEFALRQNELDVFNRVVFRFTGQELLLRPVR